MYCICTLPRGGMYCIRTLPRGGMYWDVQPNSSQFEAVYGHSLIINPSLGMYQAVIDKSLDLEKISRRNDSCFSLSSWRIVFSFLFLFSIFKIFRQQISFFSRFARFLKSILFLFSIFKIVKTKVSFYSRFMRLCSLFLFLFL